ncbi:MFS transporter [Streptomyces sp. 4N509B]|uniref:MFS transporter n=1 Tax=Streptomyces sp. 4N509B TaxID=3457413 RepID=UPI003FD6A84D
MTVPGEEAPLPSRDADVDTGDDAGGGVAVRPGLGRWAAPAPFLITGLVFASFFVRIPTIKIELGLSDGQLGVLLMLPILSGLVSMQLTGRLVARLGSAPILRATMVALPLALLCFAPVEGVAAFAVVLLLFGAVDGLIDISMNAHTIAVERALGRPVMNRCHAAWSIGAAIGSLVGGATLRADLSLAQHVLLVTAVTVALAAWAGRHLLPADADRVAAPAAAAPAVRGGGDGWRAGWTPRLLLLGAAGTIVLVVSGVVGNWSGVYLHDELDATLATASLGYVCFSVCEAGARLVGDRLHLRFGAAALVRSAGALAVVGLTVVVLSPTPTVAITGFALLGLGLSVLVPVIFSSVGHAGADSASGNAAAALAKVSTLTYSGLLVGPMVVGWFAEAFTLTSTFAGMLVVTAVVLGVGLRAV